MDLTQGADCSSGDMLSSQRSNDLHNLTAHQEELGLSNSDMFVAVESLSFKYHRENRLNSC